MIDSHSTVSWPPKPEELLCDERKPLEFLRYFYETLLLSKNKSEKYTGFVDSFSLDIMFVISNGKYATLKHTSFGLRLHSIAGMNPIIFWSILIILYHMTYFVRQKQHKLSYHKNS